MRVVWTLIAIGVLGAVWYGYSIYLWSIRPLAPPEDPVFVIEPGTTFQAVAIELAERGVIDDRFNFNVVARLRGIERAVQAGEYSFNKPSSPLQVLQVIVAGDVIEYTAKIVEGTTFAQMVTSLATVPKLTDDVSHLTVFTVVGALELPVEINHGEGLFFPESYRFERGDMASNILRRAYHLQVSELGKAWNNRSEHVLLDSAYELLILASIVEKESALSEDRVRISGVMQRRLQTQMLLQVDPTVIYGVGDEFQGDLTSVHLRTPSPYNTYLNAGLPPTPICAVSRDALYAGANPTQNNDLYFVARGDGSSEFSATIDQHLDAVRRYQLR